MIFKVLSFLFIFSFAQAGSNSCLGTFQHLFKISVLKPTGEAMLSLSSGRKMAIIFEKADPNANRKKEIFVMLHGVSETAEAHSELALEMRQKGFDVLRLSLHGHGKTVIEEVKTNAVPYEIPVEHNISDVAEILQRLGNREVILAGHSYGGAVVLGTMEKLGSNSKNIKKVVLFSSFVKSLEKYYMDSMVSGGGLVQAGKLTWKAMGFSGHLVEAMFAPYEAMTAPATNWSKKWLDHYYHYTKADEIRDLAMGPMLEMFKNIQFPMSYFFQAPPTKGEENLNLKFELRMKGALAAIRGVKDLDFLNSTQTLRLPQEPEYVLISGSKDDIVTPNMMNDFEGRLQSQNYHVRSQMLTGGHYVVREKPAEVAVLLETLSN